MVFTLGKHPFLLECSFARRCQLRSVNSRSPVRFITVSFFPVLLLLATFATGEILFPFLKLERTCWFNVFPWRVLFVLLAFATASFDCLIDSCIIVKFF